MAYAQAHLRDLVADATSLTLQSLRQWGAPSEMVVALSRESEKGIGAGILAVPRHGESGRRLPFATNTASSRTREFMKEVGNRRKAITAAATVSTIVVSAAHMIATADLARKLKVVDEKLDRLLAYRRIDQAARLERIYTAARELLASPLDEVRRMELRHLRDELRELRITWRREFEHHLMQIEDPAQAQWISRMFTTQTSSDKRIVGQISDGQLHVTMLEYSLRLDRVLAVSSNTLEASETTLADELVAIERVGVALNEKAKFISESGRGSATPLIEAIDDIVTNYRGLLPPRPSPPADTIVKPRTEQQLDRE